MKVGFTSAACPQWDLDTLIKQAAAWGYQAVELAALQGQSHLPAAPDLAGDPAGAAGRFRDAGVELAALAAEEPLHSRDARALADAKARVRATIELAAALGCPCVRVPAGPLPAGQQRQAVMPRIADALRELAGFAAAHHVVIALENRGAFGGSRELWFMLDAAQHPAARCCWNALQARLAGDRPTLAVPRLAGLLALVHLTDARFSGDAVEAFTPPGEGDLELERTLDLLRGVGYEGGLIWEWPRRAPDAERVLPVAAARLREMLERLAFAKELSAYKGDKSVPVFAPRPAGR